MSIIALGYIGLNVSDVDGWKIWARDFLGAMEGAPSPSGITRLRLDDQAWRIALEPGDLDDVCRIGLEVADAASLVALRDRLSAAGIEVAAANDALLAERGVMGMIHCKDPEGLCVELYYGPTVQSEIPFVSPQGVRFVTGDQGAGHLALATMDLKAARHFYLDLLGFRQSDHIRMAMGPDLHVDLEFYYCNPRHHTLAVAPVPFKLPKRMHHFMVQVETLDQVGFALDRAERTNTRVVNSLGRHSNDKMVSFYVATPSGFELEYGFGAIEVDSAIWSMARHDKISSWGHKRL
ncbi:MAG: VOC family protein [Alphaproteobacteria bacterium]|nr:VOC family protein [Alphaproteobacteria bacterium]